ncbi:MAG: peptide ABC transporter ATP-binding protein [Chlamydiae bacterium]|nr:MAG: peptide ABC transporter ATP-binding protein [Chlamydiota bacterium]
MKQSLLSVKNLSVQFFDKDKRIHAVRDVSFTLATNQILAIVGESGCGKTTLAKAIIALLPPEKIAIKGQIYYQNQPLLPFVEEKMQTIRGRHIAMIFQDPMTSLNPTIPIDKQLEEGYRLHFPKTSLQEVKAQALNLLEEVGINDPKQCLSSYPHMLSGGMRQRVLIAIALICAPQLLIADESTTALDLTIQAQILELLKKIQVKREMSILWITHDLSMVSQFCDHVMVMYAGQVIESSNAKKLFSSPLHPYTQKLLQILPQSRLTPFEPIAGFPPDLSTVSPGCSFCARCDQSMRICLSQTPALQEIKQDQLCACFRYDPRRKS